jgi:hypothetical protein
MQDKARPAALTRADRDHIRAKSITIRAKKSELVALFKFKKN